MVEAIQLTHLPPELTLYVACYKNVTNSPFLRQQLLSANQEYNYAFLDASTILSRKHVLTACFRAMNDYIHDRLKSNNVQSEIVFCLSPNNNIGDAFQRFGIQASSSDLVVVKVADDGDVSKDSLESHLSSAIEGTRTEFADGWLTEVCDLNKVRKTYKIAKPQQGKSGRLANGELGDERRDIEVQVLGMMALRGAT